MKDFFKGKFVTGLVVVATVILAGVAIFTAIRLYQLRTQPVAPTTPESEPKATGSSPIACTTLTFNLTQEPTLTPTGFLSPTVTSALTPTVTNPITPTLTPTTTLTPSPTDRPIGGNSPTPTPTSLPGATSTSTPTPTNRQIAQASPTPGGLTLPDAGISTPTLFGLMIGFLLITAALFLAL